MSSQHPVDVLIRELIATRRAATAGEVAAIVARMASAPFDERAARVRIAERGTTYLGHTLSADEPRLIYHLIKRVVIEGQWSLGTTAADYLADLRLAIRIPTARLLVYERRGGTLTASIAPTSDVLGNARRGPNSLPYLLVVYSADRGAIITGYQFSNWESIRLSEEVVWLT